MPELSSEHPSRAELDKYLNEHWNIKSEIQYFENEFGVNCQSLYVKLYDSILMSLNRLNEFPRSNKFWFNTNEKPTIYKLREFCELKLKENSEDILSLWTLLALAIKDGAVENFWSVIIEKLVKYNELDSNILIDIYLLENLTVGDNNKYLVELLTNLNLEKQAVSKLERLAKSNNEVVSNWSKNVLSELNIK